MTKIVKILVLVLMLTFMLPTSPAWACACMPDWSVMSDQEIVSAINGAKDEPRIIAGQNGELPSAPAGYRYEEDYKLVPL